jgi:agmatinase
MKTLGKASNFLGIEDELSTLDHAKVVVLPVPYEKTVSYGKGTKNGPGAILEASRYVEFYDEEARREIYRNPGVATVAPLSFSKMKDEQAINHIYESVVELNEMGKFVLMLGGEHTISQAAIAAAAEKYRDLTVVHIDAHSDLRQEYEGSKFSHASVMARVCEFLDPKRLIQVGIRAQCIEEAAFIRQAGVNTMYAHEIRTGKYTKLLKYWEDYVVEHCTPHVYFSLDIDGLDPSIMPATGTPEPNGLHWQETMNLMRKVGRKTHVVGADLVEFAPIKGLHYADLTAAKLASKMINFLVR